MSVDLVVEVLRHAPEDLNPTERLALVVIAESCNSKTRTTWYRDGWDATEVARRIGVTAESLTKVFRSLARKGCEVRVAHMVKDGKPIFAHKGKQTMFKLPCFAGQSPDEGPPFDGGQDAKARTSVRVSLDESPGKEAQSLDESPPLLLKELSSKNPSSLSPREDAANEAPHPEDRERDEFASLPNPEPKSIAHTVLVKHGCTGNEADALVAHVNRDTVKGPGWWRKLDSNEGDIPALIAEFRTVATITPSCRTCDDTGSTGDWMNTRACDCLWWRNPAAARKAFKAQLDGFPPCGHGINGGDLKAPNGWQRCSNCRGPGWVDPPAPVAVVNVQPRSGQRRSTGAMRAEQGLRVAAELDRRYPPRRSNLHVPHLDREDVSAYKTSKLYPDT